MAIHAFIGIFNILVVTVDRLLTPIALLAAIAWRRPRRTQTLDISIQAKTSQAAVIDNATPATGISSIEVAPPIQNLEPDPEMEANTKEIVRVSDKRGAELDCGSSSAVQRARCNQETETRGFGDGKATDEEYHQEVNQAAIGDAIAAVDEPECNEPATTDEFAKLESQQAPTSTSTTGTSSSRSAISVPPSRSKAVDAGKPPLSRHNKHPNMPLPKDNSQVQGPTLGAMLQRIHLNDGDVSELDFSTLAQRNKRLGAEGCALVARSLSTNHTVRNLFIRDHAIGDDGAIALSKMLCNNTTLEYLDLYGNNIGDRGAEALAQALYGHDSLKRLYVRSNLITDRGAEALARALRCNCTIKSLDLVHNRITKVGAQVLLEALDVNIHLETLGLEANPVPEFVASQLAAALARNRAESLILESQAAEKEAVKIVRRASGLETEEEEDSSSKEDDDEGWEEDDWEDDDGDSVSSGFLSCSGVTDIPLSSSGLWI
ncbi:Protein NLRC3 [Phytophthora citrophthora]|uniref:Protein NLRC3 n=1 Tax=Phytophthora citrophthora TaxID=4793 RepID=A0AAD9H0Z9_9STRA|nr:Protein NLRC3 [Phytophthora citrophthora]